MHWCRLRGPPFDINPSKQNLFWALLADHVCRALVRLKRGCARVGPTELPGIEGANLYELGLAIGSPLANLILLR